MIDEQRALWLCKKYLRSPMEPAWRFEKISAQRCDDGWLIVCRMYRWPYKSSRKWSRFFNITVGDDEEMDVRLGESSTF